MLYPLSYEGASAQPTFQRVPTADRACQGNPVSRRLGWQTLVAYVFSGTPILMRAPVADPYLERVFADRLSAREKRTAVLVDH